MILPEHIAYCIEKLEAAGFAAYAVGGCVRDDCLGRTPQDYDLCTGALPEQTEAVFAEFPLQPEGREHGTVRVVTDREVVEITSFRKEGPYSDGRHPDWVRFVDCVEDDLARRDFTVNAMAWSPVRGYADPFGGRQDLKDNLLRTVGDPWTRLREDPLRILRGVRFAVRFGLTVEPETCEAMCQLAPLLEELSRERVFGELSGILPLVKKQDMLRFAPIFCALIPELEPMVGFDQRSPHHAYDLYTHMAYVVEKVPGDPVLRWAALLHDVGKVPTFTQDATGRGHYYGHARVGAEMADAILRRLKAPTALREQAVSLIENHMTRLEPDRKQLRRRVSQLGWEQTWQCWYLQSADMASKGTGDRGEPRVEQLLRQLQQEDACVSIRQLAVTGKDLTALGIRGKAVGQTLQALLELVMDEETENTRPALLEALERIRKKENI